MENPNQIQTWLLNKVKQIDERLDSLENPQPPSKTTMPNKFITISYNYQSSTTRVRRYSRNIEGSWDVHCCGDGQWQFFDNVGEDTVAEAFENARIVAEIIKTNE